MTTTLTDRYVHAATRWLPGRMRTEVDAELRERIADTVSARGGSEHAEREALEELGDPLRVAVDYTGREPVLIGPRHFFVWLRLTTLLIVIVPPIVTVLSVVGSAIAEDSFGAIIGGAVWTFIEMTIHMIFWTTLIFAILDWTNSTGTQGDPWSIDQLPESPSESRTADLVASLVFIPLCAGLLLWQHFRSPFFEGGERIPMADPDLWSWFLPLILVVLGLELIQAFWVHRSGRTWPVAWFNAAIALLFAVPTVWVLLEDTLINPLLESHLNWESDVVTTVLEWTAIGIILVTLWEIFDGFRKAVRQ